MRNRYDMKAVIRDVLLSTQFWHPDSYFSRFAWPVEFVVRSIKDVGWRWQTLKGLIFRVPWYQTGRQLKERWQARNPGKTLEYDPGGLFQNLFMKPPGWRAIEGHHQPALGLPG